MDARLGSPTPSELPGSRRGRRVASSGRRRAIRSLAVSLGAAALLFSSGPALGAPVAIEPCALLTLDEVGGVIHGTAKQDRPHRVAINKVPVGGNCVYRSAQNKLIVIDLMVDGYPGRHQGKAFENGRQRPHAADVSGLGDRAYAITPPGGPMSVTFLRGSILVTVTVQSLGLDAAKKLAALVAPRLPATGALPPASPPSAPQAPAAQGTGKLDPALVGSWFLTHPNGRSLANLHVERDGRFSMMLLAGAKQQSGRIEGENGVLRLYPQNGRVQELQYRIVSDKQMEWTDQKGNVTVVRRQFR